MSIKLENVTELHGSEKNITMPLRDNSDKSSLQLIHILLLGLIMFTVCADRVQSGVRWTADGVAICTATDNQLSPTIVSDGAGGAIITWYDRRSGSYDIYSRRIDSTGAAQWTADGVAICTATLAQTSPTIVSDGSGGAIIAWADYRSGSNYDIYAQKINSSGAVQWTANGVAICTETGDQDSPRIASDGSGGAIIVWRDGRGAALDIYSQRINSAGAVQWTANGVAICTATNIQSSPTIVSDGSGGAIITWQDNRSGTNLDIYSQRINSAGAAQWTADGVAICTATGDQESPIIVSDGSGGAIITWPDLRNGNYDIYSQRISSTGVAQWTANGVVICTATNLQDAPTIVSDSLGGAIITWEDYRSGTNYDIYSQRISSTGVVQWLANGVAICTATGDQDYPTIVSDGSAGAIITWYDRRSGNWHIYSQRIDSTGAAQWTANGVAICTATNDQDSPTIASDSVGGAIITWQDQRNSGATGYDIYSQRISNDASTITSITPASGSNNGVTNITNLAGTNFLTGATVKLTKTGQTDITGSNVTVVSATKITCSFDLTNKTAGNWNVVVTNTDGQSSTLSNGFQITQSATNTTNTTNTQIDNQNDVTIDIPVTRRIIIFIPVNTFNKQITLTVNSQPTLPAVTGQSEFTSTNAGVEITTSDSNTKPLKAMTITLYYLSGDVTGLDENTLVIAYYNTTTGKWMTLPSKCYPELKKVTATVPHLSMFQIMRYRVPTDLSNAKVYPNPFRPGSNARVNITGLTAGAVLKIYTISGEKVTEVTADSTGNAIWDGRTNNGDLVGSGIYICYISDGTNKKILKIAVER